jgi:WD40 repeat protein
MKSSVVTAAVYRIKILPNGQVFTSFSDSSIRIWNIANPLSWTLVRTYTGHAGPTYGIEYIRADTLATGSLDKTIQIWRISTGALVFTPAISPGTLVYSVALLTDGVTLASACSNRINLYNVNNGTLLRSFTASPSTITELLVISSTTLASTGFDYRIRIWSLTTNTALFIMSGHTNNVYGLKRISADMIASASIDTTIRLWNITNGNLIRNLTGHTNSLQYSIDYLSCSILASGSVGTEGFILWNVFSGQSLTISTSGLQIQSLAVYGSASSELN